MRSGTRRFANKLHKEPSLMIHLFEPHLSLLIVIPNKITTTHQPRAFLLQAVGSSRFVLPHLRFGFSLTSQTGYMGFLHFRSTRSGLSFQQLGWRQHTTACATPAAAAASTTTATSNVDCRCNRHQVSSRQEAVRLQRFAEVRSVHKHRPWRVRLLQEPTGIC